MIRFAFIFLLCLAAAQAQSPFGIGIGVKGGLHSDGWFGAVDSGHVTATDQSSNFTGGPAVEVRFLDTFGIEAGALYRKLGLDWSSGLAGVSSANARERGSIWAFPILGKVRLGRVARFRPFLAGGVTVHRLRSSENYSREETVSQPDGSLITVRNTGTLAHSESFPGLTLGAGIERPFSRLRFSLEGRYVRVKADKSPCYVRCRNQDHFTVLAGFGF